MHTYCDDSVLAVEESYDSDVELADSSNRLFLAGEWLFHINVLVLVSLGVYVFTERIYDCFAALFVTRVILCELQDCSECSFSWIQVWIETAEVDLIDSSLIWHWNVLVLIWQAGTNQSGFHRKWIDVDSAADSNLIVWVWSSWWHWEWITKRLIVWATQLAHTVLTFATNKVIAWKYFKVSLLLYLSARATLQFELDVQIHTI